MFKCILIMKKIKENKKFLIFGFKIYLKINDFEQVS
jgi:hypothetical protein